MPRKLPPLNALRAFEAAGRHASFSRAAAELNVSHAAISRHVRGLEQRLGIQLFKTVARGVELTERGADYLSSITPAFDAIALATDELAPNRDELLSISCEPTFAVKWLMPRLGLFREQCPGIEIKLEASSHLADLGRYECDVAIRYGSGLWSGVNSELISESPCYPVGAPDLKADGGTIREPWEIVEFNLLHEDNGALWRRWFEEAGIGNTTPSVVQGGLSTVLAIEAALAGQGLALISEDLAAKDLESGRLVRYSDIALEYGGYYLVSLETTARRRAPKAFRDWILQASRQFRSG